MWPLAFHAHLSFLSSINNGTLSVCCRLAVPVLCRTVLLFSSINIIGSHFYIVTIINVYGVSVYFVKISTKCFFWLPFSFMRMIFVCFFCFVLFVSIIVGDAIEIDYFLIVVPIATFLSTCWYSFSLVRLLLYFWFALRFFYIVATTLMVNEPLAVFFLCTKFTFVETLSAIPKWLMFAIFFLLSYSFIFIQLSIFKSEFHMWSYLFWCLVFCVVRPQLSFFDENINKLILKIGNDKRNQLESSSDWQRKHAGKKTQPLWTNEIK